MTGFFDIFRRKPSAQKLEDMLARLAGCGVTLRAPYIVETLLEREDGDRARLERGTLLELLYSMSLSPVFHGDSADEFPSLCGQVVTFDTECIEGPGSYAPLLEELAGLTGGALRLDAIMDEVEHGQADAGLRFACNGQPVRLRFDQDDDWFNPLVTDCLAALLNASDSGRASGGGGLRYFEVNTGDQCAMYGCLPPAQIEKLKALGIPVRVMDHRLPLAGVEAG